MLKVYHTLKINFCTCYPESKEYALNLSNVKKYNKKKL